MECPHKTTHRVCDDCDTVLDNLSGEFSNMRLGDMLAHSSIEVRRHAQGVLKALDKSNKAPELKPIESSKKFQCEVRGCTQPAAEAFIIDNEKRFLCAFHSE